MKTRRMKDYVDWIYYTEQQNIIMQINNYIFTYLHNDIYIYIFFCQLAI